MIRKSWYVAVVVLSAAVLSAAATQRADANDWRDDLDIVHAPPRGSMIRLPLVPNPALGLVIQVEGNRVPDAGYDGFSIRVMPTAAVAADRNLTLVISPRSRSYMPPQHGMTIQVPIEVPQGSQAFTLTTAVPKYFYGNNYLITLLEDGRPVPDATAELGSPDTSWRFGQYPIVMLRNAWTDWLILDLTNQSKLQSLAVDRSGQPIDPTASGNTDSPTVSPAKWLLPQVSGSVLRQNFIRDADRLTTDWRVLRLHSQILMGLADLRRLKQKHPAQLAAIVRYAAAGGSVVIMDGYDHRDELLELFNCSDTAMPVRSGATGSNRRWRSSFFDSIQRHLISPELVTVDNWQRLGLEMPRNGYRTQVFFITPPPDPSSLWRDQDPDGNAVPTPVSEPTSSPDGIAGSSAGNGSMSIQPTMGYELLIDESGQRIRFPQSVAEDLEELNKQLQTSATKFRDIGDSQVISLGAGQIVGLKTFPDVPLRLNPHFDQLRQSYFFPASLPELQRGVEPLHGDRRYYRWLIPGVAQPPVYTFMGLLFLFVICVGPVAYRWTSRTQRLHWMFAIAPILAIMTTGLLLVYGLVSDGLKTQARLRQITIIDGRSGDAFRRTRACYFAGLSLPDGLRFAGDAEVMPHYDFTGFQWEDRDFRREESLGTVTVTPQTQHFSPSFLPPREQCQFVTHRPLESYGSLRLDSQPASQSPDLISTLATPLRDVVVRDRSGQYWTVPSIAGDSQPVRCQRIDQVTASRKLGQMFQQQRLLAEVTSSNDPAQRPPFGTSRDDSRQERDLTILLLENQGSSAALDGIFEFRLEMMLLRDGELPPAYFAATAQIDSADLAVAAEPVHSVHFVLGSLP